MKLVGYILLSLCSIVNSKAFSQVIENRVKINDDISISRKDTNITGIFIFVREQSTNYLTNRLINGLFALDASGLVDKQNFEVYLINIDSPEYLCSNKCLSLDEIELPSHFNIDPYRILVRPGKDFFSLCKVRLGDNYMNLYSSSPNTDNKVTPLLYTKDYYSILTLVRYPMEIEINARIIELERIIEHQKKEIDNLVEAQYKQLKKK